MTRIKCGEVLEDNDTIFQSFTVSIGDNTEWVITFGAGRYTDTVVRKSKPNPWRTPGKYFDTFEDAYNYYKSENLKNALQTSKDEFESKHNVRVV